MVCCLLPFIQLSRFQALNTYILLKHLNLCCQLPIYGESIFNDDNYKQYATETSAEAFSKFLNIAGDYLVQCNDNIHMRNAQYYKYVISHGLTTIGHVFQNLYMYTNNIELTSSIVRKPSITISSSLAMEMTIIVFCSLTQRTQLYSFTRNYL